MLRTPFRVADDLTALDRSYTERSFEGGNPTALAVHLGDRKKRERPRPEIPRGVEDVPLVGCFVQYFQKRRPDMDLGLKGKTAIVTGGASNIGRAISIAFGEEGANVSIADLDEQGGSKVAELIQSKGGKARFNKADVTTFSDAERVVKDTLEQFG